MDLYCDEAGYTGRNLLSNEQPYFVYTALNLSEAEIKNAHKLIAKNYKLQNGEVKGAKIVKSSKGQVVIMQLFEKYSNNARIVFHDKKYVIAGKIIENAVEPYLHNNEQFYMTKLHVYLATGLYSYFVSQDSTAEELFTEFEQIVRGKLSVSESTFETVTGKKTSN